MSTTSALTSSRAAIHPLRAKLFHGFADSSRLAILEALRSAPQTVGDLVNLTGLSQPNTSNHLSCLLDCGLVEREQQGRSAVYSIADQRIVVLLALADEVLADHAAQIAACTQYDVLKGE